MTAFARKERPVHLESLVDALRDRLAGRSDVHEAWVFGSYARGDADEYSDVDLIVVADSARPFVTRFRDFRELDELGIPVEVLIYTPEEFERLKDEERPFVVAALEDGVRVA